MLVEFIGIPGSGKSAIRDSLVKKLQIDSRDKFLTRDEAFWEVAKTEIDRFYRLILNLLPRRFSVILSNKFRNRSLMQYYAQNRFIAKYGGAFNTYLSCNEYEQMTLEDKQKSIGFFLATGSMFEVINGKLGDDVFVFFAEGFVQKSFMFLLPEKENGPDKNMIYNYLSQIPRPDVVIYVKTEPTICIKRMKSRVKGVPTRLMHLGESELLKFLTIADSHLRDVSNYLTKTNDIAIIEIDNQAPIETVVHETYNKFIKNHTW